MKNISFALTKDQIRARLKFLTHRDGWLQAKPGDWLMGVEKGMGLKPGEQIVRLGPVMILATRRRKLRDFTVAECVLEGFPEKSPEDFIEMYCRHMSVTREDLQTGIEFGYPAFMQEGLGLWVPTIAGSLARPTLMPRTMYPNQLREFYDLPDTPWPVDEIKRFFEERRCERENSE